MAHSCFDMISRQLGLRCGEPVDNHFASIKRPLEFCAQIEIIADVIFWTQKTQKMQNIFFHKIDLATFEETRDHRIVFECLFLEVLIKIVKNICLHLFLFFFLKTCGNLPYQAER